MDTAKQIRKYRAEAGLSQAALAKKASLSKAYVSELEAGMGRRPSGDVLLRIADALGVTIADLMGRPLGPSTRTPVIPKALAEFASERKLPEGDVMMLAGIHWRGKPPKTKERWAYIYDAIRMSASMDRG